MESDDESSANGVPVRLNQTTALTRGNWMARDRAASMIHWPLVTPGGSPEVGSALAYSASIIGLSAFSDASRS